MSILGKAIASYVTKLKGLYSIELPGALKNEMEEIVNSCNQSQGFRSVLVLENKSLASNAYAILWDEILGWRTDDDRIFVWERGGREPDTSFKSAVKPFISSHFPGEPAGECTLDLFATISIMELWKQQERDPVGDSYEAFDATARWLIGVLKLSFEGVGSTPNNHWSDYFLTHWSNILTEVNQTLTELVQNGGIIQPRHAWELIRVAGVPVPDKLAPGGNPFLASPMELPERDWGQFAQFWQGVVDDYVSIPGKIDTLLTALDQLVIGSNDTTSWRGLGWSDASNYASSLGIESAPILGKVAFTVSGSPSLLSETIPTYPNAPKPAWWGVNERDIKKAIKDLEEKKLFEPSESCKEIYPLFPGSKDIYLLLLREGIVSSTPTAKKFLTKVQFTNLKITFKEPWKKVVLSPIEPDNWNEGEAWINQDDIEIKVTGCKVTKSQVIVINDEFLEIAFDLDVEFSGRIDEASQKASGKWNPTKTLKLTTDIRYLGGQGTTVRPVDVSFKLIIPFPYSPTVLITENTSSKVDIEPNEGDNFFLDKDGKDWLVESTPDILLPKEGDYKLTIYDARVQADGNSFRQLGNPRRNGEPIAQLENAGLYSDVVPLDEGDTITLLDPGGKENEVAIVKVQERSGSLSSGLLSAVKGLSAGKKQPSSYVRETLLGRYQDQISEALQIISSAETGPNSLYQYVIASNESMMIWPAHDGQASPNFLFDINKVGKLPGIENGPSTKLINSPEWTSFMLAMKAVINSVGITPSSPKLWLSGFNPGSIPANIVKGYVNAHSALIVVAKQLSEADAFWASYPFSIVIVEGKSGPQLGQLQAIFLSPLHPARLAWAYSVAFIAMNCNLGRRLVGLAEGWNIPLTGSAISITGQKIQLVAVPIDPGSDQDFATWSALAVLDTTGLAKLPAIAAGLPIPWGGLTGLNQNVIQHSIKDYLSVHPHINSLEIDIRSVSEAPRSKEVDDSVLKLLSTKSLDEMRSIGGGTRVWDSNYRRGDPPTRDDLFATREEDEHSTPFEWRLYQPPNYPQDADLALIENSSVNLAIVKGNTTGILGLLPLRRFCPQSINGITLSQNFEPQSGEDLLGLADLLREMEFVFENETSLSATPQKNAIGIGLGARWEILGTFNIDPALLSSLVASASENSQDSRLLWEWRPSWLAIGQELARRPYYVVGRVPAPIAKALEFRQGLTTTNAEELLRELGRRGIGLTSLYAAGGTQESAAAGFFYAIKLLLKFSEQPDYNNSSSQTIGLIPIDPIDPILSEMGGNLDRNKRRADILLARISFSDNITNICFIPVEVKHHGEQRNPEELPPNSHEELKRAREQLRQTKELLSQIAEKTQPKTNTLSEVVGCYVNRTALATIIDLMMSFAPQPPSEKTREKALRDIIEGRFSIGIGNPLLLWFAPGSATFSGQIRTIDPYKDLLQTDCGIREVFIDPAMVPGIWWKDVTPGPDDQQTQEDFNSVLEEALGECTGCGNISTNMDDLKASLFESLFGPENEPGKDAPKSNEAHEDDELSKGSSAESLASNTLEPSSNDVKHENDTIPGENLSSTAEDSLATIDETKKSPKPKFVVPKAFIGWPEATTRWGIIGKLSEINEPVALDFDNPKTAGIFGYMGSGKSYLLGNIIESTLEEIPGINVLPVPLSVVIFNYRSNASDRFELSSLALPNDKDEDVKKLAIEYQAKPKGIKDLHVLCLPGELSNSRKEEYGLAKSSELYFSPDQLTVEDWELLMGEPGSNAVFARTIRNALLDLRLSGKITFDSLQEKVLSKLGKQSGRAAELRFEFVNRYLSEERGTDFEALLKPGRAVVVDLRQPLFNRDDAMRFFLVCANSISKVQGQFNKLVVFDEAHEYLSDEFGEKIENRIRNMRHEGTSYIFATQDVGSIPLAIRRFITTKFVFSLGTRENVEDLLKFAPEFKEREQQLMGIISGHCFIQSGQSISNLFGRPRLVKIRPRVTQHGGASRIFTRKD